MTMMYLDLRPNLRRLSWKKGKITSSAAYTELKSG